MARQTVNSSDLSSRPGPRGLRRGSLPVSRASRSTLARAELVSRVAEALCREWCEDLDDRNMHDARFWKQFMEEARLHIDYDGIVGVDQISWWHWPHLPVSATAACRSSGGFA